MRASRGNFGTLDLCIKLSTKLPATFPHMDQDMPVALGKRKRRAEIADDGSDQKSSLNNGESQDLQALFRKHFEAQFEPLLETRPTPVPVAENEEGNVIDESGSYWEGLSEEEEANAPLVQYTTSRTARPEMSREELKAFMVCVSTANDILGHIDGII